jgi:LuxR family maltose regulon positive regulatory protein
VVDDSSSTPATPGRPFIKRPRLTRLLDEAQARVLMLVAPAGYGKTTLAHEWLEGRRGASAWYTCIPASADVAALAVGIGEAAAAVVPGAAERLRTRLRVTNAPEREVEVLAELLAEDLASWPEDAWLCLDDYHFTRRSPAAEQLVERLLALAPLRLLIATRERPSWASARRILYGELVELGTSALAMTHEEAGEVLAAAGPARLPGVLALTDGWPAAIGLAAVMPDFRIPEEGLPSQLYEYIAEELYQSADPELQLRLCQLAVAPQPTLELLEHLFGEEAQSVVEDAIRLGFLTARGGGSFDLHPLLRAFLEEKLRERGEGVVAEVSDRVGAFLLDRRRWDDAFAIASRFHRADLLATVVETSLDEMLADGRLPTLENWLQTAANVDSHPILSLAEAEIAFRQGHYGKAEALATRAAARLPSGHTDVSRSLYRAGQAASLADRPDRAFDHFTGSRREAVSEADIRHALWGQLMTAFYFKSEETERLLAELESLGAPTTDDLLRLETGRSINNYIRGSIGASLERATSALHLVSHAKDPLVRSSFLGTVAIALILSARYSDATGITAMLVREVEEYRLRFALPHALVYRAAAHLGLRQFRSALSHAQRAETVAAEQDDVHSQVNAAAVRMRIRVSQNSPELALRESLANWNRDPIPGMAAEFLASRAIALGCAGLVKDAIEHTERAESLSSIPEVQVLCAATRAIVALRDRSPNVGSKISALVETVASTGDKDSLVVAYRGFPDLVPALVERGARELITDLLRQTNDATLARHAGIPHAGMQPQRRVAALSHREEEVLRLLAHGMSNREIARTLFISESTAKVHVRNVLRKLNVRSRTEAALLATERD